MIWIDVVSRRNDGINDFATDVFSSYYMYHINDYNKQNDIYSFADENNLGQFEGTEMEEKFNGNIAQSYQLDYTNRIINTLYNYDQFNQLINADIALLEPGEMYPDYNSVSNITYDANGNLLSLDRWNNNEWTDDGSLHRFNYNYTPNTNQLENVINYSNFESRDYQYNAIGQMIQQSGVYNQDITYNATGLVSSINTPDGNANYAYDDRGHRLRSATSLASGNETVYIRDASGNVLSIYKKSGGSYTQAEVPIYGASRLGTYQKSIANRTVYELKDHLGNVRAVIDRNKNAIGDPVVYQSTDYWPFGSVMCATINGEKYRYGYQGEYAEDETDETGYNNFELRLYDPVIGRWFAPDPYGQYPSPYVGMGNDPVNGIDPDGGWKWRATAWFKSLGIPGSRVVKEGGEWAVQWDTQYQNENGYGTWTHSIIDGGPGIDTNLEIGIVNTVDFTYKFGVNMTQDIGVSGYSFDAGSVEVMKVKYDLNQFIRGKWHGQTNGSRYITYGGRVESAGGDVKAYLYNNADGSFNSMEFGIGAPGLEAKIKFDHLGFHSLRIGAQEDTGLSAGHSINISIFSGLEIKRD